MMKGQEDKKPDIDYLNITYLNIKQCCLIV